MSDNVTRESEQHEQNMRDLRLIRDDPGWALTAVQEWRRLAAQLEESATHLRVLREAVDNFCSRSPSCICHLADSAPQEKP